MKNNSFNSHLKTFPRLPCKVSDPFCGRRERLERIRTSASKNLPGYVVALKADHYFIPQRRG